MNIEHKMANVFEYCAVFLKFSALLVPLVIVTQVGNVCMYGVYGAYNYYGLVRQVYIHFTCVSA